MSAAEQRPADKPTPQRMRLRGVWCARYPDGSGVYLFTTELDALRHAVGTPMEVLHLPYGEDALTYKVTP